MIVEHTGLDVIHIMKELGYKNLTLAHLNYYKRKKIVVPTGSQKVRTRTTYNLADLVVLAALMYLKKNKIAISQFKESALTELRNMLKQIRKDSIIAITPTSAQAINNKGRLFFEKESIIYLIPLGQIVRRIREIIKEKNK